MTERRITSACSRRGYRRDKRRSVCPASLWLASALSLGRRAGDAPTVMSDGIIRGCEAVKEELRILELVLQY